LTEPRKQRPLLLAVPNVSEGRDANVIAAVGEAFGTSARLLDVHSDADHDRSVYTLAGPPGGLADALVTGAATVVARIDVMTALPRGTPGARADLAPDRIDGEPPGVHPFVGALDVAPIVYLDERTRGAACAEALVLADRLGEELSLPVFLYGELTGSVYGELTGTGGATATTRAQLRAGGLAGLARRLAAGELRPDFGPPRLHPRAGATLVAARPPLVAFNLTLAPPATPLDAQRVAALVREGGPEGLPGLRAIGVALAGGVAQVSMNVERPFALPLASIVEAVRRHGDVAGAELVGLAPESALAGFPDDLPLSGFDPELHLLERALG
jgi:glutamate formiminotransferase / 5-formyltetrahydrofolate cyclo-ligase